MPELPIMLDVRDWPGILMGACCLVAALVTVYRARRASEITARSVIGGLAVAGLGVLLLVQPLGWELRVDDAGIALSAPFDLLYRSGKVAWADMTAVEFIDRPSRGGSNYFLRISGRDGTELLVAAAETLPPPFAVALQKVVAARAPQLTGVGDLAGQLAFVRQNTHDVLARTYSAQDGRGNALP
jgi:hypothetical protein